MATLRLRGLHKEYPNGFHAVRGVSADVADGEFIAIVGPSGCGKTSVLRMIAGLESITAGEIHIDDERVNDDTPQQRDIAMAFQEHALYPHLTIEQNIGFALKVAGVHRREIAARVRALAVDLGLDDVLDRRPSKVSGGQQQRAAMGRAIIRDPRLFLMDEPLSNLDAKLRTEARATIASVHRRLGTTTVYVTHDQLEAMSMADRVLVMRRGLVVQEGTPIDVYRAPLDLFVGSFMGSPSMSCVLGRVEPGPGGWVVCVGSHRWSVPHTALSLEPGDPAIGEGRRLVVGLRPESVRLDPEGAVEMSVDSAEPLGHDWLVRLVVDAPAVTIGEPSDDMRVSSHPYATISSLARLDRPPGLFAPVRVSIDPVGLHLFDPGDGASIGRGVAPVPRSA